MTPTLSAGLYVLTAYLIGSIPFGYFVARARGVDIFRAGSGNIGATNVGRVLGRAWGVLVFLLDFSKGAIGTALPLAAGADPAVTVASALAAFLGHMFPVYIGFRGGKGVATGLGTVVVLAPGPALVTALAWLAVSSSTRLVSLASLVGVGVLAVSRLAGVPDPFAGDALPVTAYLLGGGALVVLKHRSNVARLWAGSENQLTDTPMWHNLSKCLHVVALGLWFGSAIFFNFLAAPMIFGEFKTVVETSPNDRTAHMSLLTETDPERREQQADRLYKALAGTAVGPLFGPFFAIQAVCGVVALATAIGWCCGRPRRFVDRFRAWILGLGLLTVVAGWPISEKVAELRVQRYIDDPTVAQTAAAAFGEWHLISLLLSMVTALFVTVAMGLAGVLPERRRPENDVVGPPPTTPGNVVSPATEEYRL